MNTMPPTRTSITHKFTVGCQEGYVTVGLRGDGSPGEIFLIVQEVGTLARGLGHIVAILTSLCLKHGVPLEEIVGEFKGVAFEPQGFTKNKEIPQARSIVDYLGKWLELKFIR